MTNQIQCVPLKFFLCSSLSRQQLSGLVRRAKAADEAIKWAEIENGRNLLCRRISLSILLPCLLACVAPCLLRQLFASAMPAKTSCVNTEQQGRQKALWQIGLETFDENTCVHSTVNNDKYFKHILSSSKLGFETHLRLILTIVYFL
jgi:hypothetical protein